MINNKYNRIIRVGNIFPTKKRDNPTTGRVYDIRGYAPTIGTMSGAATDGSCTKYRW